MAKFALAMIVCSDLERSKGFYRNILELKLRTDASPHWADFELGGGQVLGLHPTSESITVKPGSVQLGFQVDDVDRFVVDAQTAGVRILQEPHDEGAGRLAVIADPDGYPIQIASPKKRNPR